jgi:leucyl aminopeptidase
MLKLPSIGISKDRKPADTEMVIVFQDKEKKAAAASGPYSAIVSRLSKDELFSAQGGSSEHLRFGGKASANVLLLGFGQASKLTEENARQYGGTAWSKLCANKAKTVTVDTSALFSAELSSGVTLERVIRAFTEGLLLAAYRFDKYKTKGAKEGNRPNHNPEHVLFRITEGKIRESIEEELEAARAAAEAVSITRDWSNEPSNIGTPVYFATEAQRLAHANGLSCRILTEQDAKREKMNLFLGVGLGSEREGRIVIVEYKPRGKGRNKTVVLAGKGVTFDSGGISIKPSARMDEMKHDMTGAATVMGAVVLASKWKVRNRVIGIMAFTENMPDGEAIQPGNVIVSRAGKTVEIVNTDAEGRLVLADILDYAQELKPDYLIDVATLTGAVSVALGKYCCGIMGNDDQLASLLNSAATKSGERMWQLPLYDEYFDDLKSETADMKNSGSDAYGGTIRGAAFLKQFIKKGTSWFHLDIASTAYNLPHLSYCPKKGASGSYVRTLAQLVADI